MKMKLLLAGLIASIGLAGSAVAAPDYTWNLNPSTDLPGPVAGSYSFSSGGEIVNAFGYATQNTDGSGLFSKQTVSLWDGGLGIKTAGVSNESSSPNHAADNDGRDELFVFEFSSADYIATGFQIGWNNYTSGSSQPDLRVWVGGNDTIDFSNACFIGCANTLDSLGFTSFLFENVGVNTTQALNGGAGKYLIIAADYSIADSQNCTYTWAKQYGIWVKVETCTPTFKNDYFKLSVITGTEPPHEIPEPTSTALVALALFALAAFQRRKQTIR